jgi:hypothetical protein
VVALFVFVLQVSLDCPFFIAPFVFTDVYFRPVSCVTGATQKAKKDEQHGSPQN